MQVARDIEDLKRSKPVAASPVKKQDFMDRSLNDRATFLRTQGLDASMNQRMQSTLHGKTSLTAAPLQNTIVNADKSSNDAGKLYAGGFIQHLQPRDPVTQQKPSAFADPTDIDDDVEVKTTQGTFPPFDLLLEQLARPPQVTEPMNSFTLSKMRKTNEETFGHNAEREIKKSHQEADLDRLISESETGSNFDAVDNAYAAMDAFD